MKKLLGIINHAPIGNSFSHEALEMLMIFAAFDFEVTLLLRGAGVMHLQQKQHPELLNFKNHSALYKALDLYEINQLLVDGKAMIDYQCSANREIQYQVVDEQTIACSIAEYSEVLNF